MTKFIISTSGISTKIYWMETQESPTQGIWVANKRKATLFSKENVALRYAKKYIVSTWWNSPSPIVEKVEAK